MRHRRVERIRQDDTVTHTSDVPPVDLSRVVPGIGAHIRHTVRLHPRPGAPGLRDSHIGGPLLWPTAEEWPRCAAADCYLYEGAPLVPLAQLTAADFPEITFPDDTDLVQLLWCGGDWDSEAVRVFWRRAADVTDVLTDPPTSELDDEPMAEEFFPRPCVLDPERVPEYPWYEELPDELRARLRAWIPGPAEEYYPQLYNEVATAPGFKVGGSMNWSTTDMPQLACPICSAPPVLLLQLDTYEFDRSGDRVSRWQPLEERHLIHHTPEYELACEPTGLLVGRGSRGGVFVCSTNPEHWTGFFCQ